MYADPNSEGHHSMRAPRLSVERRRFESRFRRLSMHRQCRAFRPNPSWLESRRFRADTQTWMRLVLFSSIGIARWMLLYENYLNINSRTTHFALFYDSRRLQREHEGSMREKVTMHTWDFPGFVDVKRISDKKNPRQPSLFKMSFLWEKETPGLISRVNEKPGTNLCQPLK